MGGYLWQTSSSQLFKRLETGIDTLVLEGISAEDLSFTWFGSGGENLWITVAGEPSGDTLGLYQQSVVGRIEKLALDGLGTMNFLVAPSTGTALSGSTDADIIFGLSGNDTLNGSAGNDLLYSGAGADTLVGGVGDDTLVGQSGNDYQNGQDGSDRYVYRRGDGADKIEDFIMVATTATADISAAQAVGVSATGIVNAWVGGYHWQSGSGTLLKLTTSSGSDTLALENNIRVEDLSFLWSGPGNDNLLISIAGGPAGDSINLGQQKTAASKIEKLTLDEIGTVNLIVAASVGATATGTANADLVAGLAGNEHLNGGAGDDVLAGATGNDTLTGGLGIDSYRFGPGHGSDTIVESGAYADHDELVFGAGIDANELWFAQQDNNLVISVLGTTDKVTVANWFQNPGAVVETIKSGDGQILRHSDVATLVAAMAGFNPATSPGGTGIQPGDPQLGDPAQIGSIAAAMNSSWMAA